MYIRFIAHAGFALEEDGHQVLIDPWFTDSTVKTPIMQAVVGHNTIDFQVPKTTESIGAYHPDTILLSHFHAHHAVHDDLVTLATQSKRIALCFPDVGQDNTRVEQTFALWPHVETIPFQHNDVKTDGPFSVRGLLHTVPKHIAWYVESKTGSILHIADPHINRDSMSRQIGEEWKQFEGLQPDLLCINAGGNGLRREKDGPACPACGRRVVLGALMACAGGEIFYPETGEYHRYWGYVACRIHGLLYNGAIVRACPRSNA